MIDCILGITQQRHTSLIKADVFTGKQRKGQQKEDGEREKKAKRKERKKEREKGEERESYL